MFEFKPDYEKVHGRFVAWWDGGIVDRPLTSIVFPKPEAERVDRPGGEHASIRERWLDAEYQAERAVAEVCNTVWYADALPVRFPNLGPEVFSSFYGCELEFGETTSWSVPILDDLDPARVDALRCDLESFYFRRLVELTEALLDVGRGRFIVGYSDLHSGGDAVAALRNPQDLCLDVVTDPAEVRRFNDRVTDDFLRVYDLFHARLSAAGMPSTTWLNAVCEGKMHVPSNDFSCMISDEAFEGLFLPGLVRECAHMDRSIYHLDGPGALRLLDRILEIPKLHAIQWVPGAGREHWRQWLPVYRCVRERGKSIMVWVPLEDLEEFTASLRPEGVWLNVTGVACQEDADSAMRHVSRWGVSVRV